ncbi:MAG: CinA family protein [Firmicutes bacterium]|nr:CinA family protein [Bacillota bacterium]
MMAQAASIIDELRRRKLAVATAESCTGGMLAAALTDVPGSSDVFGWGLVTYSNEAKAQLLGVSRDTLAEFGAVSPQTAREMASGLLRVSGADIALATTGIAGPGGGSAEKPVGLVYIACGDEDDLQVKRCLFSGGRDAVRRQTVAEVLFMLERFMEDR